MIYVEVHGSSSLKSWSHVILATSTVTLSACIGRIWTNRNKALVRSSRAFTIPSIGLQTSHQAYRCSRAHNSGTCPGLCAFAHGRTTMKHFVLSIALSALVILAVSASTQAAYSSRNNGFIKTSSISICLLQIGTNPWYCPPKAEVRGSNPFGRAICVQNRERVRFLAGYRQSLLPGRPFRQLF